MSFCVGMKDLHAAAMAGSIDAQSIVLSPTRVCKLHHVAAPASRNETRRRCPRVGGLSTAWRSLFDMPWRTNHTIASFDASFRMNFSLLDWSAVIAYLGITLLLGLYFRSRSGKSVDEYFVSGR